jgi:aspartyl-tRNA(Asn)/glutamyl-tRNA(Gln) amidotransferase subunit B
MRIPTIGLEIHAELKTKTKMFCGCRNDAGETKPNVNVCPVCLAHPGTLPVANKAAILSVIELGLAVGGKIAEHSHFDRKSYFYPDLPKAYQITQYEEPFVAGGMLKDIRIRRVHLEEDTGRLLHT